MKEKMYYNEIKTLIESYEINHKVRVLQDNSEKLQMNWNIGRLLVEAQGRAKRAKYGDDLIKNWSLNLEMKYVIVLENFGKCENFIYCFQNRAR